MNTPSRGWFAVEYELPDTDMSDAALGVLIRLRRDCVARETDGFIQRRQTAGVSAEVMAELLDSHLLVQNGTGYQDVGYLLHNTSHVGMEKKRADWRRWQDKHRGVRHDTPPDTPPESGVSPSPSHTQSPSPAPTQQRRGKASLSLTRTATARKRSVARASKEVPDHNWLQEGQDLLEVAWDDTEEAMERILGWGLRRPLDEDDRLWARLILKNSRYCENVGYLVTPIVEEFLARANAGDPIVSPHYLRSYIDLSDEDLEGELRLASVANDGQEPRP